GRREPWQWYPPGRRERAGGRPVSVCGRPGDRHHPPDPTGVRRFFFKQKTAYEMNELMFYSSLKTGDAPGQMASVVKMRGTEVGQKVTELAVEAVGWYGVPFTELRNYDSNIVPVGGEYGDDVAPPYFNNRNATIYGGSSEVQRNVLAKAMLGL